MNWPIAQLRKVAPSTTAKIKFNPSEEVWHLNLDQIESNTGEIIEKKLALASVAGNSTYIFDDKNVLYSKLRPYLNKVVCPNEPGIATTELVPLCPQPKLLDRNFLTYYLRSNSFVNFASAMVAGAKMPRVIMAKFWDHQIPLPTLSEQRRIVKTLDQADRLRTLRAEADNMAERILPALFIKMFGDPATNPMGWPNNDTFGDVGKLARGKSRHRPRNAPELLGGDHPLIQTGDVANSGGRIRNYTQTYSDIGLAQSRMWPKGTLCITIAANIAKTGVLEFDACFPDSVVGFHPGPDVTTEYVQSWLYFLQPILESNAPQAAQKNINLQILRTLPITRPPMPLQEKFSAMVIEYYKQIDNQLYRGKKLDELFNTIVHRAFTGDLTASWRQVHMKELLQEMELQANALAS